MSHQLSELYLATLAYHPLAPLVLSRNIDLLSHQLAALYGEHDQTHKCPSPIPHRVVGLLRAGFPINALIADETGLGKTIITGFFILSLMLRGMARNIAIVVPKAVVGQWQDELLYKFGIYFKVIEHGSEFFDLTDELKHGRELRFITSIDLIKGRYGQEFVSALQEGCLDLAVIDEAHHVITRKETLRAKIALSLARKSKALVLMSATPFRGYYEAEYKRVIELLNPGFIYVRRFKDQVTRADGRPLFPKRISYTVDVSPDPQWFQVYTRLKNLIEAAPLPQLTRLVLLKRLSSSFYALYATLKKLQPPKAEDPFSEETDDVSGVEPDMREDIHKYAKTPVRGLQVALDVIRTFINGKKPTLKEVEFLRLLQPLVRRGKVVVFTEYRTTLERLKELLMEADIKFVFVHGGMSLRERRHAISTFWNDAKVRVFLATDAAGEGINLQIASYQINYDLPWSPLKLEQRFGRIHRYGQRHTTHVYNIAVRGTIDNYILNRIMRKLDNVAKLLGDWIYDYIGIAIRPDEVRKLVVEGNDAIDERTIIRRFKILRSEVHNPKFDSSLVNELLLRLKNYVDRYLRNTENGHINVLEVLRTSRLVIQRINSGQGGTVDTTDDVIIAVYRLHNYIIALHFLERKGNRFLDPINSVYVDHNEAVRYLSEHVRELAHFYGFKGGDVQIYSI